MCKENEIFDFGLNWYIKEWIYLTRQGRNCYNKCQSSYKKIINLQDSNSYNQLNDLLALITLNYY